LKDRHVPKGTLTPRDLVGKLDVLAALITPRSISRMRDARRTPARRRERLSFQRRDRPFRR